MTPTFEERLRRFMRARGIRSKSEAVRVAVEEGLQRVQGVVPDYREWLGLACGEGENPNLRFSSDEDVWS